MKTVVKILILIAELLGCLAAFVGAVWGTFKLCELLAQSLEYDIVDMLAFYTLYYAIPTLLSFGYALLVYVVLKSRPKRILIALINGVVMMGLTTGAFLLFTEDLLLYMQFAPIMCIFSLIVAVILLALRPKSLPQAVTAPEAAVIAPEAAVEIK